ncbi:MAG: dihydropteroate synthase [Gammaproteobacteria bacterium]|jgi:dihydropteroate synthase
MQFKTRQLDLSQPQVMGILNVTPDSFSDGGRFSSAEAALQQARRMVDEGATIVDVGGESTRPGAQPVATAEELERVVPVVERIARELDVIISVDTCKPEVMQAAVAAGAHMVNDVMALRENGALAAVAALQVPVCLMHMQGEPRTMQTRPVYDDVVADIRGFLQQRLQACLAAGIARDQLILDPGFGFGKSLQHNLTLFKHLPRFVELGYPVLVGVSRKSMLGSILDLPVEQRMPGSIGLAALAVWLGASIIRAHDVGPTIQAIRAVEAVKSVREEQDGA